MPFWVVLHTLSLMNISSYDGIRKQPENVSSLKKPPVVSTVKRHTKPDAIKADHRVSSKQFCAKKQIQNLQNNLTP